MTRPIYSPLPARRGQEEVIARWEGNPAEPLVTVVCVTYNHTRFIRAALDGMLGQNTNFPFKILVRDDGSNDGTREILEAYRDKFPQVLELVLEERRSYPFRKAWAEVYPTLSTQYVALCDGDDYWFDRNKLQVQVDFLSQNPKYSYCHHQAVTIDEVGEVSGLKALPDRYGKSFRQQRQTSNGLAVTSTIVHRNIHLDYRTVAERILNEDELIRAILLSQGYSKFLPQIVATAYRQHSRGVWTGLGELERKGVQSNSFYWISSYLASLGLLKQSRVFSKRSFILALEGSKIGGTWSLAHAFSRVIFVLSSLDPRELGELFTRGHRVIDFRERQ